jgi:hypothetical protein
MTGNLACNIENSLDAIHDHILKFAGITSTALLDYQMCEENARIASVDTWWAIFITGDSQLKLQLLCTKASENLVWIYCTSDGWVERSQADRNSPHKSTRNIPSITRKFFHPSLYRNVTHAASGQHDLFSAPESNIQEKWS